MARAATPSDLDLFPAPQPQAPLAEAMRPQRLEDVAGDWVTAAFGRGAVASVAPGTGLRWVVDDHGGPCPDCDDNALARPTAAGDPFPTGQVHPPAHVGCRCLLVRDSGSGA